jgi:hypothetical protein
VTSVFVIGNTYLILGIMILYAFFIFVVAYGMLGFFLMNLNLTSYKCPNCTEKLGPGVVVCKYCRINLHSLSVSN